jgi:Fe-S-cluster containining protein
MKLLSYLPASFVPLFNSFSSSNAARMRLFCVMPRPAELTSKEQQKRFQRFLQRADARKVLRQLPELHDEAVAANNCLSCAACCKNYSPRFKTPDVKRISKHLRLKESVFIETYLNVDEEGDFVAKSTPCPFLGSDNYCSIYDVRPSDCARFPYTDEDVLLKRQKLTLKNATFCPIVHHVLDKLSADLVTVPPRPR